VARLLGGKEMGRLIVELIFCWLVTFGVLYLVNPDKSAFPASIAVSFLAVASLLRGSTLFTTLRHANLWLIAVGGAFLLLFALESIFEAWREEIYIVPVVISAVALLDSVNKSIQERIGRRGLDRRA
jgi:hypothetical protein